MEETQTSTLWQKHQNDGVKIVINTKMYEPEKDDRLLVPFICKNSWRTPGKFGLLDKDGEVVLPAEYDAIFDDCYSPDDIIRVGKIFSFGYEKANGHFSPQVRYRFRAINTKGEFLLENEYDEIEISTDKRYLTVRDYENNYFRASFDIEGNMIVPFGKYQWMESFDRGLARVSNDWKYGIINTNGEEVVPLEYDRIWSWYKKNYDTIILEKDGVQYEASFDNPSVVTRLGHHLEGHPPIDGQFEL